MDHGHTLVVPALEPREDAAAAINGGQAAADRPVVILTGSGLALTFALRSSAVPELIAENWVGTRWVVEVLATFSRAGKPFQATLLFVASLRTTIKAVRQLV